MNFNKCSQAIERGVKREKVLENKERERKLMQKKLLEGPQVSFITWSQYWLLRVHYEIIKRGKAKCANISNCSNACASICWTTKFSISSSKHWKQSVTTFQNKIQWICWLCMMNDMVLVSWYCEFLHQLLPSKRQTLSHPWNMHWPHICNI